MIHYDELLSDIKQNYIESLHTNFKNEKRQSHKSIPFSTILDEKLRNSTVGQFLEDFNRIEEKRRHLVQENNLNIFKWNLLHNFSWLERKEIIENDKCTIDPIPLIEDAIATDRPFNKELLYNTLKYLKIVDTDMTETNAELEKFKKLEVLSLSGNCIKEVTGAHLPRNLRVLELYVNFITDLTELCMDAPVTLLYLGLGYNDIRDDCILETPFDKLKNLRSLDISDNNLQSLESVLSALKLLPRLLALQLDGNPCYTCVGYKDIVCIYLPKLVYLDNTRIPKVNKQFNVNINIQEDCSKGVFTFTCFRLTGLPQPPKVKKINKTFHFEIELPLLDNNFRFLQEPEVEEKEEEVIKSDDKKDDKKQTKKDKKKPAKEKGEKGSKKQNTVYDLPDEYLEEIRLKKKNFCFATERQVWKKIIQFNEPSIEVEAPDNDLMALRDTLRSEVKLKLIYLEWMPPEKKKKEKGSKKDKSSKNKKGSKKNDKTLSKSSETRVEKEIIIEEELKELILKKITLATIPCQLLKVNWSKETNDYYWTQNVDTLHHAIYVSGDLKSVKYAEKAKAPKKGKETIEVEHGPFPLSKTLTCEFGFGLKRLKSERSPS